MTHITRYMQKYLILVKMEIPGILNNQLLEYTKIMIMELLKPLVSDNIYFIEKHRRKQCY